MREIWNFQSHAIFRFFLLTLLDSLVKFLKRFLFFLSGNCRIRGFRWWWIPSTQTLPRGGLSNSKLSKLASVSKTRVFKKQQSSIFLNYCIVFSFYWIFGAPSWMGNSSSTSHPNPQFVRRNESFGSSSPRKAEKVNNHQANNQNAKAVSQNSF